MPRQRLTRFWEIELTSDLPPEQEQKRKFYVDRQIVSGYMTQKGADKTACLSTDSCFAVLNDYLEENRFCYSPSTAEQWFHEAGPHPFGYHAALYRLADVYTYWQNPAKQRLS